jgi:hypothetical protein
VSSAESVGSMSHSSIARARWVRFVQVETNGRIDISPVRCVMDLAMLHGIEDSSKKKGGK